MDVGVVDLVEEDESEVIAAADEVVDEELDAGGMEATLVGDNDDDGEGEKEEEKEEEESDNPDAEACTDERLVSWNDAVCEGLGDSHDPSGSWQSTLKELIEDMATHRSKGASVASLLQELSEYTVTITTNQSVYLGLCSSLHRGILGLSDRRSRYHCALSAHSSHREVVRS